MLRVRSIGAIIFEKTKIYMFTIENKFNIFPIYAKPDIYVSVFFIFLFFYSLEKSVILLKNEACIARN